MSPNKERYVKIIKEQFPNIYKEIDPDYKLSLNQFWIQMDKIIEESKGYHCGLDMSGLVHTLSLIKSGETEELKEMECVKFYNIYSESYKRYKRLKPLQKEYNNEK